MTGKKNKTIQIAYYIEDAQFQENSLVDSVLKKIYSNNDMVVYRIE